MIMSMEHVLIMLLVLSQLQNVLLMVQGWDRVQLITIRSTRKRTNPEIIRYLSADNAGFGP